MIRDVLFKCLAMLVGLLEGRLDKGRGRVGVYIGKEEERGGRAVEEGGGGNESSGEGGEGNLGVSSLDDR